MLYVYTKLIFNHITVQKIYRKNIIRRKKLAKNKESATSEATARMNSLIAKYTFS